MASLNADQSSAVDAWLGFMLSDESFFVISGPAGTGKTFLMNYLSNQGMQLYHNVLKVMDEPAQYDEIAFTATTNKAAEVLSQSIGKPVQTIHSYIGLKIQNDYSNGKTFLTKSRSFTVYKAQGSTYEHVFIDIGNIGTSFDPSQVARMLYVAVSRAKGKVYLYGSLPGRYHNSQGASLWTPENGQQRLLTNSSATTEAA